METSKFMYHTNNHVRSRDMDAKRDGNKKPTKNTGQCPQKNHQNTTHNPNRNNSSGNRHMEYKTPTMEKTNNVPPQNNNTTKRLDHIQDNDKQKQSVARKSGRSPQGVRNNNGNNKSNKHATTKANNKQTTKPVPTRHSKRNSGTEIQSPPLRKPPSTIKTNVYE